MATSVSWTLQPAGRSDWTVTVVRPHTSSGADPSLGELADADLVAACLDGRSGAFDVIVERHRRTIYQLCYRFVGNHEDASDLSQDVFLRAFRGLKRFRGQSSLGTWLYRIGVNVCLNKVSAKVPASEPVREAEQVDTHSEAPSDRMLREERAERVREAVSRLPEKQRVALILRMYHELSHQEIADIMGSSASAVKANVFHALQNLKRLIRQEEL